MEVNTISDYVLDCKKVENKVIFLKQWILQLTFSSWLPVVNQVYTSMFYFETFSEILHL